MDCANPGDSARLATLCNRMGRLWSEQTIEIFYETQPSPDEDEEVIPETPQPPPILMPLQWKQPVPVAMKSDPIAAKSPLGKGWEEACRSSPYAILS